MSSELRVNKLTNTTGINTITFTTSDAEFSGNVSIAGTLTYVDLANIDAVGIITAQSDVSIADKIIHTGDTNTALRFPAADTFTVETGGSERIRVDSSGRLAIGNVTPQSFTGNASDNLVVGSGSGGEGITIYSATDNQGALSFADGTSGDAQYRGAVSYNHTADRMDFRVNGTTIAAAIDSAGKFGIGTQSPEDLLHLQSGSSGASSVGAAQLVLESSGSNNWIHFKNPNTQNAGLIWSDAAATERAYIFYDNNVDKMYFKSDGVGSAMILDGGLAIFKGAQFNSNITPSSGEGVEIFQAATGVGQISSYDRTNSDWDALRLKASQFEFFTEGTERVRIASDGNVGVNDTAPARKFSVVDSAGSMVHFGIASGHGGYLGSTIASQAFLSGGAYYSGSNWVASDSYAQYINMYHGTIRFATSTGLTSGNTFTPTERMMINASGVTHCSNNTSDSQHYNSYNCHLHHTDDTDFTTLIENSHNSNPNCLGLHMSDAAPNNTSSMYLQCYDTASGTTTVRSAIYSDGSSYFTGGVKLGGTGTANNLDDYEEGSWTPALSSDWTSVTYTIQRGRYIKIGNLVYIYYTLQMSAATSPGSAYAFAIHGIPFTGYDYLAGYFTGAVGDSNIDIFTTDNWTNCWYGGAGTSFSFTDMGGNTSLRCGANITSTSHGYISGHMLWSADTF